MTSPTDMTATEYANLPCAERIANELKKTAEVFTTYMNDSNVYENGNEDLPPFYEYGLSFDYVEPDSFTCQPIGYYRYQLSWGGPSDELRFHHDGQITYHFMDWFDGAERDVTHCDWAEWLQTWFTEIGSIDWDKVEIFSDSYYDSDDEDEDEDEDDKDE